MTPWLFDCLTFRLFDCITCWSSHPNKIDEEHFTMTTFITVVCSWTWNGVSSLVPTFHWCQKQAKLLVFDVFCKSSKYQPGMWFFFFLVQVVKKVMKSDEILKSFVALNLLKWLGVCKHSVWFGKCYCLITALWQQILITPSQLADHLSHEPKNMFNVCYYGPSLF